jgi:hypothetical protein
MNISEELNSRLSAINSRIIVTPKGSQQEFKVLYNKYLPYFHRTNRKIKIYNVNDENEFTVELFKQRPYFRACARVKGFDALTDLLYEWLDKRSSVELMVGKFSDFKYLKPFPIQNLDNVRENLWLGIKSQLFFYYIVCWNLKKSFAIYEQLLEEAKNREELKIFYPSISLHYLRFKTSASYDKSKYVPGLLMATNKSETKGTRYLSEIETTEPEGDFFINGILLPNEKIEFYTNDAKEAVDFFVSKCVNSGVRF